MDRTPEQRSYGADLKFLSDNELFEKLRAPMKQLRSDSRFSDIDGRLMWKSKALESEVIDRFPEERMKRFKAWLATYVASKLPEG